ncbi:MAG TPA: IPTL-CTERM sorting domain-containing protein, partial [Candidatus Methanoperedens sp.]|nr:IPTL-CTERM sorting domain-containing protein [Candidatus Methanoperedens sp.]
PYTFSVIAGALPAGLTLTTAGVLSGTPTAAQTYTFTVQGVDANGCFNDRTYTLTVGSAVPTMSQWLLLLLALGLLGLGYLRLRRRAVV